MLQNLKLNIPSKTIFYKIAEKYYLKKVIVGSTQLFFFFFKYITSIKSFISYNIMSNISKYSVYINNISNVPPSVRIITIRQTYI